MKSNGKHKVIARITRPGFVLAVLLVMVLSSSSAGRAQLSATSPAAQPSTKAASSAEIPAGAQSVVSATLGKADEAYRAKRSGQGYATENPANHLAAQYAADGVKIRFQYANLNLEFQGWGYGRTGVKEVQAAVAPYADANRVEYRRGALTEWYVNGPLGIEQGFTISKAPVASPPSQQDALDIALRLGGTLSASVEPGRHALTLRDQSGVQTLRYGTLLAYDASGRELESWMEVQGDSVQLRVNTAGARYPIMVDPWVQAAELTNSSGLAQDQLARSVAVSGNIVVVGAPFVNSDQGAVYVFVEPPTGCWANTGIYIAEMKGGAAGDNFGWSVGINASGDTIVVGAPYVNSQQGAAYVFVAPSTVGGVPIWTSQTPLSYNAELTASNGAAGDFFGTSVAVSGSASSGGTIVVGASDRSAAYVFSEPTPPGGAPTWTSPTPLPSNAELTASGSSYGFGYAVAINESANTIVVSAPAIDDNVFEGAAYVFVEPTVNNVLTWTSPTPLPYAAELTDGVTVTSPQNPPLDWFGNSVGISGNTVVVGAPEATVGANTQQGAAYVFVAPNSNDYTSWAMEPTTPTTYNAQLTASNGLGYGYLGTAVGISGNTVVAGATGAESGTGAAYVFVEPTNSEGVPTWASVHETTELPPSDGGFSDVFGYAVAISGNTIVVGAPELTVNNHAFQGAAYVFTQSGVATYTIGGSVTGLTSGTSVTLLDTDNSDSVTVTYPATSFTFPTALASGADYAVAVGTQPTGETCSVTSGSGAVASANITNVSVTCTANAAQPTGLTLTLSPNPASAGATVTATATITPSSGISSVTGTVGFAASLASSFNPVLLCPQASVENNAGRWQATCQFTEGTAASYVIAAAYSGDALNQASNTQASLTVNAVAVPLTISPTALPAGTAGTPYSQTLTATGGSGTGYTWAIISGAASLANFDVILSPTPPTAVIVGIPSAAGMVSFTVQVTDSLGDTAMQTYTLTINNPAPIASLSPTSLAFAAQVSGTTSAAQTVTLTNTGNAPLSLSGTGLGISISGANATDFAQTNQCGTSVAAYGSNCPINVTFTPSLSAGSETAILNVADNASGTPQQVQLSGIALPPPSVSCTIPIINLSGDSGTVQITCTATDFAGTIALECNLPTSLSQYITCSFSPSSLNFASSSTATTTLTIQQVQGASLQRKSWPWAVSSGRVAFGAVLWLPAWALVMRRKKGSPKQGISRRGLLLMLIALCGLPLITSCGGKSGPPTPPAGTYQASVVLTGPGLNETITITIQEP